MNGQNQYISLRNSDIPYCNFWYCTVYCTSNHLGTFYMLGRLSLLRLVWGKLCITFSPGSLVPCHFVPVSLASFIGYRIIVHTYHISILRSGGVELWSLPPMSGRHASAYLRHTYNSIKHLRPVFENCYLKNQVSFVFSEFHCSLVPEYRD